MKLINYSLKSKLDIFNMDNLEKFLKTFMKIRQLIYIQRNTNEYQYITLMIKYRMMKSMYIFECLKKTYPTEYCMNIIHNLLAWPWGKKFRYSKSYGKKLLKIFLKLLYAVFL